MLYPPQSLAGRGALVICHPGHELRLHGILEHFRPTVFILTDGSGRSGVGRLEWTARLLSRVGAPQGEIFGPQRDRTCYEFLLRREYDELLRIADALTAALSRGQFDWIAGDAMDGTILGHDLCRILIEAAADRLSFPVRNLEFNVEGRPDFCPVEERGEAVCFQLTNEAHRRKVDAARAYEPLAAEFEKLLRAFGTEGFRREWLWPSTAAAVQAEHLDTPPAYERHGESLVAAGLYTEAIRYRDHLLPLAEALSAGRVGRLA